MNIRIPSPPPRSLWLCASLCLLSSAEIPARADSVRSLSANEVLLFAATSVRAQDAAPAAPPQALVTALRGAEITLDVGTEQGAVRGAVYGIAREGRVQARVQILTPRAQDSLARVLSAEDGFVLAVGDVLQFQSIQPVPETPAIPATPTTPDTPATPAAPDTPVTPPVITPQPGTGTTATVTPSTGAAATGSVVSINGTTVVFNAGSKQGIRTNTRVAITRNGEAVGIARIIIVEEDRSTGEILFADSSLGGVQAGDAIPISATPAVPGIDAPPPIIVAPTPTPANRVVSAPVRYETGASNEVVPRADERYDYLAALAASRLLPPEYPAHVFHDEGSRTHRTEEDLTLSRAQIAALTLGAVRAADELNVELSRRELAALRALGDKFPQELQQLGATPEELQVLAVPARQDQTGATSTSIAQAAPSDAVAPDANPATPGATSDAPAIGAAITSDDGGRRRFVFGVSGQQRGSLVSGSGRDNEAALPFSERQGGLRTRSGIDTRTNIFGSVGDNVRFFGQLSGGSRPGSGTDRDDGFRINEAYVNFNANKLLRGLDIKAGRDEIWWGPGHFGTLVLGDTSGPLNLIETSFKRGSYEVRSLYAPLDRGPQGGRRSLYGHNVSVRIGKQARVGFAETLLLPRSRLDAISFVGAFSPLPLFALERLRNRNTDVENGNILTEAYLETSIARGVRGHIEFLIDDLGVNDNNLVRNRLGTIVGAHFFTPRDPGKLGLFAEVASLQGRTYLALRSPNDSDYFFRGDPIGHPVAPVPGAGSGTANGGAESVRLEAYWRPVAKLRLGAGVEFADLNSEDTFRSRQQVIRLRAAYDIGRNFTIVGRVQRTSTDRPNFAAGSVRQNLLQLEVVRAY